MTNEQKQIESEIEQAIEESEIEQAILLQREIVEKCYKRINKAEAKLETAQSILQALGNAY